MVVRQRNSLVLEFLTVGNISWIHSLFSCELIMKTTRHIYSISKENLEINPYRYVISSRIITYTSRRKLHSRNVVIDMAI